MSPEYAMEGLFSIKSDVYSFGVLLLEIISGRRNSSFYLENSSSNLLVHVREPSTDGLTLELNLSQFLQSENFPFLQVWELWKDGSCLDIVDTSMGDAYPEHEVLRCIQIGLLCVQEFATDRPTMSAVVFMLGNKVAPPSPKQPASTFKRRQNRTETTSSSEKTNSVNDLSLTAVDGR